MYRFEAGARLADFSKTAILPERGAKNGFWKRSYIGCLLESILGPILDRFWDHFGAHFGAVLELILDSFGTVLELASKTKKSIKTINKW